MELLSPRRVPRPNFSVTFGVTSSFEYTDPVLGVPMTKSINLISMNSEKVNHVPSPNRPSQEQMLTYGAMQALVKSCVDNAEDIKDRLHQMYIAKTNPKTEDERIAMMEIDLMGLRKWFMDDIRSSKIYKEFTQYNSTQKLSMFSKPFYRFIEDRNKYTHGQLCFLSPNFEFVIEYIDSESKQKEYAFVSIEVLQSYNNFYKEILKVISEYSIIHQKKDGETSN